MRVIKNIVLFMMFAGFFLVPAEAQNFSASYKFMKAVKEQDYREIKVAIEKGVNINTRDYDDDTTPLIIATKKKDVSLAGYLISNGAKTDLYGKDGKVPLLIAAAGGDNAMVDLLIKEGAGLNFADDNGTTPLIAAVLARKDQIVASLLKAGADYTIEDYSGRSPLQHAIDGRRRNAERLLKDAGAVR
ncbi:MAG: ankyrin repeat domain-containing protein [Emcibacter sp.]|nr:ankyrin repeat domain-containing protein [Emcibacter sp.]